MNLFEKHLEEPDWNFTLYIAVDTSGNISVLGHEDKDAVHPSFQDADFSDIMLDKPAGVYKCTWYWEDMGYEDYESAIKDYRANIYDDLMELVWVVPERRKE